MKKFLVAVLSLSMFLLFIVFQITVEDDAELSTTMTHQLNDFEWLRESKNLSEYVKPDEATELYLPKHINGIEERDNIACFVLSSPKNVLERNAIRRTWGSIIKPVFLIAKSDNETMRLVISEAMLFNDIIVEYFQDSYVNLTLKTAFAMKHFLRHFKNSTYFLKIDDDVYLNVDNLKKMIDDEKTPKDSIIGRKVTYLKPHREIDSKLYIPHWMFEGDEFSPYIDGPAYLIPGFMIERIFETSLTVPIITLEDVFFIGEVAGRNLNFKITDNRLFRTYKAPFVLPCFFDLYITIHQTLPNETLQIWENLQTNHKCSVSERLRSFIEFNRDMTSKT